MGMAASQARYLALAARKTNIEYQGQQINQARMNLANQTASLFNQMLGVNVPIPPSTQDFTKTQYSFTDGVNPAVIDKWEQLANPDTDGYNYVVEFHYDAQIYKGFQKKMNDPQVQFNISVPTSIKKYDEYTEIQKIYTAQQEVNEAQDTYDEEEAKLIALKTKGTKIATYRDMSATNITNCTYDKTSTPPKYTVTGGTAAGDYIAYTDLTDSTATKITEAKNIINAWKNEGIDIDETTLYFKGTGEDVVFAFEDDLNNLISSDDRNSGVMSTLPLYHGGKQNSADPGTQTFASVYGMQKAISDQTTTTQTALNNLKAKESVLETMNLPTYAGNSKLTSLAELSPEEFAEIKQIITDMTKNGADCNFVKCFKSSLNISAEDYSGGIYKFERDGITYYTTYYDLAQTAYDSEFTNDIDNQPKLNYYYANYVTEPVYKSDKAILDTDSKGRFKTVRFKEDGSEYKLNFEQITDDDAYQDAMNKYYYENARYDKMIQDINAKTSMIQQEDRTLELKLKQLDTEQNALSNEMEAVQKIVKEGVEKGFKTFGG